MAQVLNLGLRERTFGHFEEKLALFQNTKCLLQMLEMANQCLAVDKDIVKKHNDKLVEERPKGFIHCCLEGGRSIAQSKGPYAKFVMPVMSAKCCFPDVSFLHQNLVRPLKQVELQEPLSPTQFV